VGSRRGISNIAIRLKLRAIAEGCAIDPREDRAAEPEDDGEGVLLERRQRAEPMREDIDEARRPGRRPRPPEELGRGVEGDREVIAVVVEVELRVGVLQPQFASWWVVQASE
jgi:hypothetical protein